MSRTKEFDTDAALERAMRLFWRRGYEATSVQDLVDELGLNRSSLYATFGDKAQLFDRVIDRYQARATETYAALLAPPNAGREAVEGFLSAMIDAITDDENGERGCLLVNAAGCVTAPDDIIARAKAAMCSNETAILAALRRDPKLKKRSDLPALARFFAAQGHGLGILARAGAKPAELRASMRVALTVLD